MLLAHPFREAFGPERLEALFRAVGDGRVDIGHARRGDLRLRLRAAARFGMPVDGDVGEIVQELGGAVLALDGGEELRRRVDEAGGVGVVAEFSRGR